MLVDQSQLVGSYPGVSEMGAGRITHDAYAPLPIVLEMMRKGKSFGSGSNCDCCIFESCF